jgi:NADPH:quinone reductase-like Zn-dependent oxidoreductase
MAEQTVIDIRRSVVLPDSVDPVAMAAAMNPAMSSWVALRRRVPLHPGQSVLVLGATGNAGRMAVRIATLLGAGQIVAAGRSIDRLAALPALGATATVLLGGGAGGAAERLGQAAAEVDVVIDYLWGEPTAATMTAVVTNRTDRSKPLTWIEVGSVAGATAAIPSAALRAARLQIVGSGQGSVSAWEYVAELPALAAEIAAGTLDAGARAMPLAEVGRAWALAARATERIVLVPRP